MHHEGVTLSRNKFSMSPETTKLMFESAKAGLDSSMESLIHNPEVKSAMRILLDALYDSGAPASATVTNHGAFDGGLTCHVHCVWEIARGLFGQAHPTMNSMALGLRQYLGDIQGKLPEVHDNISGLNYESLFKVCVIHDFNKIRTLNGKPYYVSNILASGKRSTAKPWEKSEESDPVVVTRKLIKDLSVQLTPGLADLPTTPFLEFLDPRFFSYREGLVSLATALHVSPEIGPFLNAMEREAIILHDGAYAGKTGLIGKESMLQIVLHAADMLASQFFC